MEWPQKPFKNLTQKVHKTQNLINVIHLYIIIKSLSYKEAKSSKQGYSIQTQHMI